MLERRDDAGGGERAALGRDPGRRIEADRILGLAGVEVAHVIDARARDGVENVLGEVAVRIDDGDALARVDVAHGEIEQERAFARAGFADDVDVALALLAREDNTARRARSSQLEKALGSITSRQPPVKTRCCQCSSRLPSCALPYLWRSGGTRHAERPMVGCSRRTTRDRRHAVRRGDFSLMLARTDEDFAAVGITDVLLLPASHSRW